MPPVFFIVILLVIVVFVVLIPIVNAKQFNRLPQEQQIRVLMKQANQLIYFKNVSNGTKGTLFYIKNKRKIYLYPWRLQDGKMLCTRQNLYAAWDYPEDKPVFTPEEKQQAIEELERYNQSHTVKLYLHDDSDK